MDNSGNLKKINKIIHPEIKVKMKNFIKKNNKKKFIILDIPLLFETGGENFVDLVIVVDAPQDIQEERVLSRPNMTKEKFEKIIAEQIPNDVKKKKADFIVDTSISIEDARIQVENIIRKIKN